MVCGTNTYSRLRERVSLTSKRDDFTASVIRLFYFIINLDELI